MNELPSDHFIPPAHEQIQDLNPGEFFRVVFSHLFLITFIVALFLTGAGLYAFLYPKTYEAVTTVKVPDNSQTAEGMLRQLVPTSSGEPVETYVQICKSEVVAAAVAKTLHLSSRPEFSGLSDQQLYQTLLRGTVSVTNILKTSIISITARSHDPQLAAALANCWAQQFLQINLDLSHEGAESKVEFLEEQAKQLKQKLSNPDLRLNDESKADELIYFQILQDLQQAKLEEQINDAGIVVVDTAAVPEKSISPKKLRSLILALILGLGLGLQAAFLLDKFQDRIKDEKQLKRATGLANYAMIPNFRNEASGNFSISEKGKPSAQVLITNPVFKNSFYAESFKVLRTNLTLARAEKPPQTMAVFSPNPNEGKTLVNSNLAISMAYSGKKALLVDADFRKSSVLEIFGIGIDENRETGLPLALTGQKSWMEMVCPSGIENLDLIPNTVMPPNPAELLGSETMKKMMEEMKQKYDFVIFDSAPVLPVTDSVVLSTLLDSVVLLARFNMTRSSSVQLSLEHLHRVGAHVIGTVFNYISIKKSLYGYGYHYGYGKYQKDLSKVKVKK